PTGRQLRAAGLYRWDICPTSNAALNGLAVDADDRGDSASRQPLTGQIPDKLLPLLARHPHRLLRERVRQVRSPRREPQHLPGVRVPRLIEQVPKLERVVADRPRGELDPLRETPGFLLGQGHDDAHAARSPRSTASTSAR